MQDTVLHKYWDINGAAFITLWDALLVVHSVSEERSTPILPFVLSLVLYLAVKMVGVVPTKLWEGGTSHYHPVLFSFFCLQAIIPGM
jgi:hypothetical protein